MEFLTKDNDIFFDWISNDGNLILVGNFAGRFIVGFEAQKDCTIVVTMYLTIVLYQNDRENCF